MYLNEFCEKEVINIKDCRKLGHVTNLEFDPCNGCIFKIIVKEKCTWLNLLGVGEETVVPFNKICQIGPDIILVDLG